MYAIWKLNEWNIVDRNKQIILGKDEELLSMEPLDEKWIFRADAIASFLDKTEDQSGIRLEIRRKFWGMD